MNNLTIKEKIELVKGLIERAWDVIERTMDEAIDKYETEIFENIRLDNPDKETK